MEHCALPLRSLLLTIAIVAASMVVGCHGPADRLPPEQALTIATPSTGTSRQTPTPTATSTTPALPTATHNPTSTPIPPTTTVSDPTSNPPSDPFEGSLAPDLSLPDLEGEEVSLTSLRGKAVLLNFWASW